MEKNDLKQLFQMLSQEATVKFKKAVLENLEAFNDFNVDWQRHSGFPFLKTTSREYYLQKGFEKTIEHYVRYILVYHVLSGLLLSKDSEYNIEFLEYVQDTMNPGIRTNREYEKEMGFEFIEYRDDKRIGFRYTFLPTAKPITTELIKQIEDEKITEIVIIDWTLQETANKPSYGEAPCFKNLVIRYVTLRDFFKEYLMEDIYEDFVGFLRNTVTELQDFLGVSTIPRLTPPLLFGFRYTVEQTIVDQIALLEAQRNVWKGAFSQGKAVPAYRVIDDSTRIKPHYCDLEYRSLALLYNSVGLRTYRDKKLYRAMIGRSNFARCLITSEYLFRNYGKSDQFDFTAIVSGYVKSIEQLMFTIALFYIDKQKPDGTYYQIAPSQGNKKNTIDFTSQKLKDDEMDTTLGALCFFFKNNRKVIAFEGPYKETLINCLFCYADECRNDSFHKHNIDEWDRVEIIRSNTFFLYMMLLGCCRLGRNDDETKSKLSIADDDRISRIYYQLTTHDSLDYYVSFEGQETIEICRPREEEYPSFDRYGLLKCESLTLEVEHFNGTQPNKPSTITITNDHLPTRIWYEEEEDCSIIHEIPF